MPITHGSSPYTLPDTKKRFYKDYKPATRRSFVKRNLEETIDLKLTSDSQLWNVIHSRLTAANLPPNDVILADAEVAALMQIALDGGLRYGDFSRRWPITFDRAGRPFLRRKPQGMPAIAYFAGDTDSPQGYYYLSCQNTYTLCGQDYAESHLEHNKLNSTRGSPPYPWQHLVEQHASRGIYPVHMDRRTSHITIDRNVPVDWACINAPRVIAWDHMSPNMVKVVLSHLSIFPPETVRLCLKTAENNGKAVMEANRPESVVLPTD